MDEFVELHDIPGRTGNIIGDSGCDYEIPTTSNVDENDYMRLSYFVKSTTETDTNNSSINVDRDDVPKTMTEITALKRKMYIFCTILLTMLVVVSVTFGVLTHNLMMRTEITETKPDEMRAPAVELKDKPGVSEAEIANMQAVQTKLVELETKLETNIANTDAKIQMYLSKITHLENDRSSHTSLIQDHASRITHLESKATEHYSNYQKLDAKISSLEIENTKAQETRNALNDTLAKLTLNVSSNIENVKDQQIRINEIDSKRRDNTEDLQALHASIQSIKSRTALEILNNRQYIESKVTENYNNYQTLETKISSLERDRTTYQTNSERLNITLIHLALDISDNEESIKQHQSRIGEIESGIRQSIAERDLLNTSITILGGNMSMQMLANRNMETRITQLETKTVANDDDILNHTIRILHLEIDNINAQSNRNALNDTLTLLTLNVSTNNENIKEQQIRINNIENDRREDTEDLQALNASIKRTESTTALQIRNNRHYLESLNITVHALQSSITELEVRNDNTSRLYGNVEFRLNNLEELSVPLYDCDFEVDTCSWMQSSTDDFDWSRHSGTTGSSTTGPNGDHTTGNGYYMYIETSSPRVNGDRAEMVSSLLAAGHTYCMHLALNMYGSSIGGINVYIKPEGKTKFILQQFNQISNTATWYVRSITIPTQPHHFNIVIEGVRSTDYYGDAAIDDIYLQLGAC